VIISILPETGSAWTAIWKANEHTAEELAQFGAFDKLTDVIINGVHGPLRAIAMRKLS
jgi:hypothetical protein